MQSARQNSSWFYHHADKNHLDNYSFRLLTIYKYRHPKYFLLLTFFSIGIDNLIFKKRLLMLTNIVTSNKCYVLFFPTHKMKFKPSHIWHICFCPKYTSQHNGKSKRAKFPSRKEVL